MVAFCPFPKNLPVVKFKSNRLISLVEEISSQSNTNSIVWLLGIFLQVYNEEEQVGQIEIQNVEFGKEKDTGEINVKAKACAGKETVTVKGG